MQTTIRILLKRLESLTNYKILTIIKMEVQKKSICNMLFCDDVEELEDSFDYFEKLFDIRKPWNPLYSELFRRKFRVNDYRLYDEDNKGMKSVKSLKDICTLYLCSLYAQNNCDYNYLYSKWFHRFSSVHKLLVPQQFYDDTRYMFFLPRDMRVDEIDNIYFANFLDMENGSTHRIPLFPLGSKHKVLQAIEDRSYQIFDLFSSCVCHFSDYCVQHTRCRRILNDCDVYNDDNLHITRLYKKYKRVRQELGHIPVKLSTETKDFVDMKIHEVRDLIEEACGKIGSSVNGVARHVDSSLAIIGETLSDFKIDIGLSGGLPKLFTELSLLGYSLWNAKDWLQFSSILTLYLMRLEITATIAESFVSKVLDIFGKVRQQASVGTITNTLQELFVSFLHLITFKRMPEAADLLGFLSKVTVLDRGVKSAENLVTRITNICNLFIKYIYKQVTGNDWDTHLAPFKIWSDRVSALTPVSMSDADVDKIIEEVSKLIQEGYIYEKLVDKTNFAVEFKDRMTFLRLTANKLNYLQADTKNIIPPFPVYLYGESGVGKSTILDKIVMEYFDSTPEIKDDSERIEKISNFKEYVFYRNVETEFWDGLKYKHEIYVYDDAFQIVDNAVNGNPEIMEIIRLINATNSKPHMADVMQKGRFDLKAKMVVLTSNVSFPRPVESISHADALRRRLGIFKWKVLGPREKQMFQRMSADDIPVGQPVDYTNFILSFRNEVKLWFSEKHTVQNNIDSYKDQLLNKYRVRQQAGAELLFDFSNFVEACGKLNYLDLEEFKENSKLPLVKDLISRLMLSGYNNNLKVWFNTQVLLLTQDERELFNIYITTEPVYKYFYTNSLYRFKEKISSFYREYHFKIAEYLERNTHVISIIKVLSLAVVGFGVIKLTQWLSKKFNKYSTELASRIFYLVNKKQLENVLEPSFVRFVFINHATTGVEANDMGEWYFGFKKSLVKNNSIPKVLFGVNDYLKNKDVVNAALKSNVSQENLDFKLEIIDSNSTLDLRKAISSLPVISEGIKYDKMPVKKSQVMKLPNHVVQEGLNDQQYKQVSNSVTSNVYFVRCMLPGKKVINCGSLIALRANKYLTFGHLIPTLVKYDNFLVTKGSNDICIDVKTISVCPLLNDSSEMGHPGVMNAYDYSEWQKQYYKHVRDAVIIEIPTLQIPQNIDITKHIIPFMSMQNLNKTPGALVCVKDANSRLINSVLLERNDEIVENYSDSNQSFYVSESYVYDAITEPGNCGSPLFIINPSEQHKFVGLHIASYDAISKGIAVPIYKELIDSALKKFGATQQNGIELIEEINYVENTELPEGMYYLGHVEKVRANNETKILPSLIHGLAFIPKMAPVHLKPYYLDGVLKDPLKDGIKKYAGLREDFRSSKMDKIVSSIYDNIYLKSKYTERGYDRMFTMEEAVFGIAGEKSFGPLNRITSPGRGWPRNGFKGKTYYIRGELGSVENPPYIEKTLRDAVLKRLQMASVGRRLQVFYQDTVKDERKKIGGKTRVFSNGPMDYGIACRMAFGGFTTWFLKNRIENTSLVGINMYSDEADYIAKKMNTFPNIIAADFKNYDADERSDILLTILKSYIEKFYVNSTESERIIRETLFMDLIQSVHVCDDIAYCLVKSIPSGHPLTSVVNTLYNLVLNVFVYLDLVELKEKSVTKYFENVCPFFYGDDHIIGVKSNIAKDFNYFNISRVYAKYGHNYTDSTKNSIEEGKPFDKLSDVAILKRTLTYDKDLMRYVALLDKLVVEEIPNWVTNTNPRVVSTMENINTGIREASLYDEEYYYNYCAQHNIALRKVNLPIVAVEEWSLMRNRVLKEYEEWLD